MEVKSLMIIVLGQFLILVAHPKETIPRSQTVSTAPAKRASLRHILSRRLDYDQSGGPGEKEIPGREDGMDTSIDVPAGQKAEHNSGEHEGSGKAGIKASDEVQSTEQSVKKNFDVQDGVGVHKEAAPQPDRPNYVPPENGLRQQKGTDGASKSYFAGNLHLASTSPFPPGEQEGKRETRTRHSTQNRLYGTTSAVIPGKQRDTPVLFTRNASQAFELGPMPECNTNEQRGAGRATAADSNLSSKLESQPEFLSREHGSTLETSVPPARKILNEEYSHEGKYSGQAGISGSKKTFSAENASNYFSPRNVLFDSRDIGKAGTFAPAKPMAIPPAPLRTSSVKEGVRETGAADSTQARSLAPRPGHILGEREGTLERALPASSQVLSFAPAAEYKDIEHSDAGGTRRTSAETLSAGSSHNSFGEPYDTNQPRRIGASQYMPSFKLPINDVGEQGNTDKAGTTALSHTLFYEPSTRINHDEQWDARTTGTSSPPQGLSYRLTPEDIIRQRGSSGEAGITNTARDLPFELVAEGNIRTGETGKTDRAKATAFRPTPGGNVGYEGGNGQSVSEGSRAVLRLPPTNDLSDKSGEIHSTALPGLTPLSQTSLHELGELHIYGNSCRYEDYSLTRDLSLDLGNPCVSLKCRPEQAQLIITGCPPPPGYKLTDRDIHDFWPGCCRKQSGSDAATKSAHTWVKPGALEEQDNNLPSL